MNKLLLIMLIFVYSCSTGSRLVEKNVIKAGMTKLDVNFILSYRSFMDQITVPTAYREYFSKEKKEILAPDKKNKDIYYVFKNVYQPVKCGWILCKEGDGILDKTFSSYSEAIKYATGREKEPKKSLTIIEDNKTEEINFAADKNQETVVDDLSKLIEDYKSGKITKEEFNRQKAEILK